MLRFRGESVSTKSRTLAAVSQQSREIRPCCHSAASGLGTPGEVWLSGADCNKVLLIRIAVARSQNSAHERDAPCVLLTPINFDGNKLWTRVAATASVQFRPGIGNPRRPWEEIMKIRSTLCALIAGLLIFGFFAPSADAAIGPKHMQRLAQRQTQLLLRHFSDGDVASPTRCKEGQSRKGTDGVFLLPTRYGGAGDLTFTCRISTRTVLVDLGGAVATEDADPESTWTLSTTGEILHFTPATLERICDDLLNVYYLAPSAATLDGKPISGTRISTPAFVAKVRPTAEGAIRSLRSPKTSRQAGHQLLRLEDQASAEAGLSRDRR